MPAETVDILRLGGKVTGATRWGTEADQVEARRNLAAGKLERYIAQVVASAPPLTDEQRERLAALLTGGAR